MLVTEPRERARRLFVDEPGRTLEFSDRARERPRSPEVPSAPGDRLAGPDQPARSTTYGLLPRVGHRPLVEVNIAGQVEDVLDGGGDVGLEMDLDHVLRPGKQFLLLISSTILDARERHP
jgi:hypothetical protein